MACEFLNTPQFSASQFNLKTNTVTIDLGALLAGLAFIAPIYDPKTYMVIGQGAGARSPTPRTSDVDEELSPATICPIAKPYGSEESEDRLNCISMCSRVHDVVSNPDDPGADMAEAEPRAEPADHQLRAQDTALEKAWQIWQRWSADYLEDEKKAAAVGKWFHAQQGWPTLVGVLKSQNSQEFAAWCLRVARAAPPELGPQPIRLLNRLTVQVRLSLSKEPTNAAQAKRERIALLPGAHAVSVVRGHTPRQNAGEIFAVVQLQLQAIVRALERKEWPRAQEFLNDLIQYHLTHGGHRYLVKSLSNLATQGRRHGALHFAQHCSELAVKYAPHDPIACNGRAEVLKAQGQLTQALRAYDQILIQFPQNINARNGRAEVLKAQGRLGEARVAYDQIIAEFPDAVISRNGRAEAIKAQGNYPEALSAYEQIVADFPDNVIARNGRAAVLKKQGKLREALAAYSQILVEFPDNVTARNGRTELLRVLRKQTANPSALAGAEQGRRTRRPGSCGSGGKG